MKKVLITGDGSYIGESFRQYLLTMPDDYVVEIKDSMGWEPSVSDFVNYDVVFNVAGVAHIREKKENQHLYYEINRDLVIKIAKNAKEAGVKQFILLSTMSVYGVVTGKIDKDTLACPVSVYGKSKLEADKAIEKLEDEGFKFVCLRPPMVYGKGCKGNYQRLRKIALKSPVFPNYMNHRSMVYIGNLCEFIKECIDQEKTGLFFPQNGIYTNTSEMVKVIAECNGKKIILTRFFNWAIKTCRIDIIKKAFGNLVYEKADMVCKYGFKESIKLSEGIDTLTKEIEESDHTFTYKSEKKKKALCIATMASNLDNFNRANVEILKSLGYDVTLAANFHSTEDINSQDKIDEFTREMSAEGVRIVHIAFSRRPKKLGMQLKSILQVRSLLKQRFDLIHCHAPVCAAIVRAEAQKYRKKNKTKVLYTAHGFHFYTGAPVINWFVYYPIEKLCSRWTDVLITINQEDYRRAKEKFKAKEVVYIPGIGVDTGKFAYNDDGRERIRRELGFKDTDLILLSVGELNRNKNHSVIIKALEKMRNENIFTKNLFYVVAGTGGRKEQLERIARDAGLSNRILFVGYRSDVADLCDAADVFVFPSYREGLSLSLMEAMSSGLPCIVSNIRGNRDLIDCNGGHRVSPNSSDGWARAISSVIESKETMKSFGAHNQKKVLKFSSNMVNRKMRSIYGRVL